MCSVEADKEDGRFGSAEWRNVEPQRRAKAGKEPSFGGDNGKSFSQTLLTNGGF